MSSNDQSWESKIKFFSKFLGYDFDDFDDTHDQTNKSQLLKKPLKGIKVIQTPSSSMSQSMVIMRHHRQETDKKWLSIVKGPYFQSQKNQILNLTYQGTFSPNKIMPWLAQNKHKVNQKIFNIKRQQYRTCMKANNQYALQKITPQLQILTIKLNNLCQPALTELLGILLLYRQDIHCNDTLLSIGQTIYEYFYDCPVMAFSILYYFCCGGAFLPFLINDPDGINYVINKIYNNIKINCSSAAFLIRDQIPYQQSIKWMIESFWLNISDSVGEFRQKILFYLLLNRISLRSVSKICEATIQGLSRIINQGNRQKTIQVLNNPKVFLDQQVFLKYMFFAK